MNYFIDESGNWQYINQEKNRLVIGGLLIKTKDIIDDLNIEIKVFKNRHNLKIIHANELDKTQKDELYYIIEKYLKTDNVKAYFYLINPQILYSQTQKDADEIYADIASQLIVDMSFGDDNIDVEYDMKFHYAYPPNIIEHLKREKVRDDISIMASNFSLKSRKIKPNIDRIKNQLKRYKNIIPNVDLVIKKIETDHDYLKNYLWEEFRLKIEKASNIRERFEEKINIYIKEFIKNYQIPNYDYNIRVKYNNKYTQSAGVQVIDTLCNLVWRYGKTPPLNFEDIYKNLDIKELTKWQ